MPCMVPETIRVVLILTNLQLLVKGRLCEAFIGPLIFLETRQQIWIPGELLKSFREVEGMMVLLLPLPRLSCNCCPYRRLVTLLLQWTVLVGTSEGRL